MEILAKIENMYYEPMLCKNLNEYSLDDIRSGFAFKDASFKLRLNTGEIIAFSQWVSPKRTRSYPFARVYDTLNYQKRVTIIPLVKDEGIKGDRDYLQWDTISLMSLLGVYVIIAYYDKAEVNKRLKGKITNQQFDYDYINNNIKELLNYKLDALHWNLQQLKDIKKIQKKVEDGYYKKIKKQTRVDLHDISSFRKHVEQMSEDVDKFKEFSRTLAKSAQNREFNTIQPKEIIINEKAKITIKNYLGGLYYFTVDEIVIKKNTIFLIEKKHSNSKFFGVDDIKDALIKMALYSNFEEITIDNKKLKFYPIIGLTTNLVDSYYDEDKELEFNKIKLPKKDLDILKTLFKESEKNKFKVFIMNSNKPEKQEDIINKIIQN